MNNCSLKVSACLKRNWTNLSDERGVGLVELMISILIMAGIVAAIMVAYTNMPVSTSKGNVKIVLQQDAAIAIEEIVSQIREATTVTVSGSNDSIITSTTAGSNAYTVNGNVLYKNFGVAGSEEVLVGDYDFEQFGMQVDNIIFTDNVSTVTITLNLSVNQMRADRSGGTYTGEVVSVVVDTMSFHTEVYPRNRN